MQPLGLLVCDVDTGHVRPARPMPTRCDDGIHSGGLALEHGFDAPVAAVSHPARNTARPRARRHEHTEADALHAAAHDHAPAHDYGFSTTFRQSSRFFLNVS